MAFSKELEDVIEAALADGVITEKERAVLHKKALLEGVDPDEVDVVIDGRLQQMQNEVDKAKQKVRKCPSCGEIIPAMTAVCPSCGQVIDTCNPDNKALKEYMDKLEAALVKLKENGASNYNNKVKAELEGMIRQGRSLYGDNKKIAFLISEVEASIANFDKSHKNHIIMKAALVVIVVMLFGALVMISSYEKKNRINEIELRNQKAQEECDSLGKLIDQLPAPTKYNCVELDAKIKKICWTSAVDLEEDEEFCEYDKTWDIKHEFIKKKEAYGESIIHAYKQLWTHEYKYDQENQAHIHTYINTITGEKTTNCPIPGEGFDMYHFEN